MVFKKNYKFNLIFKELLDRDKCQGFRLARH